MRGRRQWGKIRVIRFANSCRSAGAATHHRARGCLYEPFDFRPEKNDGVVVDVIVDAGSVCTHNFGARPGYTFTGISFEREPVAFVSQVK